jgi:signal transduction histidine kinase
MVLDMLNSGQLTAEEWKALLPGLKVNVDNLYSVTDNLLRWAYAQISGRQVHKTLFPVGEVVRHVVELMASHAQEKGIAIHNRVSPDLFLCADRDQLEVVLRNLVSNALKFSPRNAALVLEGDYADALAVIRVSDTRPFFSTGFGYLR